MCVKKNIFLDITSAFDSIKPEFVRDRLLDKGGCPKLVEWYYSYIMRREMRAEVGDSSVEWVANNGFPQGGVCSALFWTVVFDPAVAIINKYGITGNAFADDCAAVIGGTHPARMRARMQKMLDELVDWGQTCGLAFNPSKSVAMFFSRRTTAPPANLRVGGAEVPFHDQTKYL